MNGTRAQAVPAPPAPPTAPAMGAASARSGVDSIKAGRADGFAARARDLVELSKPRITSMVLVTALVGFLAASDATAGRWVLLAAVIGTGLVAAGASAFNQLLERKLDGQMSRTAGRPLPAGRLGPGAALVFAAAISGGGLVVLAIGTNLLTTALAAVALLSYVAIYTPMKTRTPFCTIVGAVPGAIPPVMGYAAATGRLDLRAGALFAILFAWQIPHFLAIGWMYKDDYARAGFPMLTVLDRDGSRTGRHTVGWTLALFVATLVPFAQGMSGAIYLAGAILLGGALLLASLRLASSPTFTRARTLLLASVLYLPALLVLMVMDRLLP